MPRSARRRSRSGIYHVMLRGVNRQVIFEDDSDRIKLLKSIGKYKEVSRFQFYSYCLMDNHVHLLIREGDESISRVIQRISSSYVYWYNWKYERVGHLFQDRFKSEPIETSDSFLRVLRYIHQNPLKAGLAKDVFTSKWTSIHAYFGHKSFVDIDLALQLLSTERSKALKLFSDYMQVINDEEEFLDNRPRVRVKDTEILEFLADSGVPKVSSLQQMEKAERDAIILGLKRINGVSIGQLSRVTGISKSVIQRLK